MPRKRIKSGQSDQSTHSSQNARVVTEALIRTTDASGEPRTGKVPEIRLAGEWLNRAGFPRGTRYIVLPRPHYDEIILAKLEEKPPRRRRQD